MTDPREHPLAYIVRELVPEWFDARPARQEIINVLNSTMIDPREELRERLSALGTVDLRYPFAQDAVLDVLGDMLAENERLRERVERLEWALLHPTVAETLRADAQARLAAPSGPQEGPA